MNRHLSRYGVLIVFPLLFVLSGHAAVFTNDTVIGIFDSQYDGQDIVATNCVLTINGPHTFSGVRVQNGATLTHSISLSGYWSNQVSVTNEQHVLTGTNAVPLLQSNIDLSTLDVVDSAGTNHYTSGADYVGTSMPDLTVEISRTETSAIPDGATVQVSYTYSAPIRAGVDITATGDIIVEPGGAVSANGRGFTGGAGPGSGRSSGSPLSGGGAGYGGYGGLSLSNAPGGTCYGDTRQPADLGSGGGGGYTGPGAAGGGAIKLTASGGIRIDGLLAANGNSATNERAGGGSGGSIWLTGTNLTGTGMILANGGAGEPSIGGGGGGGRIALAFEDISFTGIAQAIGGPGGIFGGAGTVCTRSAPQEPGTIYVDNAGHSGTNTLLFPVPGLGLVVRNGANANSVGALDLASLLIGPNAVFYASFPINVTGDCTIQASGAIAADGMGFPNGSGPGAGRNGYDTSSGSGGGYGGFGAPNALGTVPGGASYGSVTQPTMSGSGGGDVVNQPLLKAGSGGGMIRLAVAGALSVDGRISSDGKPGMSSGSGGGAGGSVWIDAQSLSGFGLISADGGKGNGNGGGGGGGRISIHTVMTNNSFSGAIRAWGAGAGTNFAGPGTVFTKWGADAVGQVVLENRARNGKTGVYPASEAVGLNIGEGVALVPLGSLSLSTLNIQSNAALYLTNSTAQYSIYVSTDAQVSEGGSITADAGGYPGGQGPSPGRSNSSVPPGGGSSVYTGGGGGHGGYGAQSAYGSPGGAPYDAASVAGQPGSGGGGSPTYSGGAGGGVIRLYVSNKLTLHGRISANGVSPTNSGSGGGAGGSILISAGSLEGDGAIVADGGAGLWPGGSGAGGRVAVFCPTNLFAGAITAYGGMGTNAGGAGSVFVKPDLSASGPKWAHLIYDNGGRSGTNSENVSSLYNMDLTLKGCAVASVLGSMTLGKLFIGTNSTLWISNRSSTLTITSNAVVEAGGAIRADGASTSTSQGSGGSTYSGLTYAAGGGGYGGYGGSGSLRNAYGGVAFGSTARPVDVGGMGGNGGGTNYGGRGGGSIILNVNGGLQINGTISADGVSGGNPNSGGGAGGTVMITMNSGSFTGAGLISANGGFGSGNCGGGGGGRIGILVQSYASNLFAGNVTAFGGNGYNRGGAGTIVRSYSSQQAYNLLVDNGGVPGTNTLVTDPGYFNVTVSGGGSLAQTAGYPTWADVLVRTNSAIVLGLASPSINGNVTVEAGGAIHANGTGYPGGQGPGAGRSYSGTGSAQGGAGYGGIGGGNPPNIGYYGQTYGNTVSPSDRGSGGGNASGSSFSPFGGAGGGVLRLGMPNRILTVDGRISSDGRPGDPNSGGGSGGTVWITAGTIRGKGSITANGGAGNGTGGGGGGGRIELEYSTNLLTGPVVALGGSGYAPGGPGTVYLKPGNQNLRPQLVIDSGGPGGPATPVGRGVVGADLIVTNGASAAVALAFFANNLILYPNTSLWFSNYSGVQLSVSGDATVYPGAAILADGTGFPGGQGPGAGSTASSAYGITGGGGGHGGFGAPSMPGSAGGRGLYDSPLDPQYGGSGGGNGSGTSGATGGIGGGSIILDVAKTLRNDGRISADGLTGGPGAGGGAGGTIRLTATSLSGSGSISANGGNGNGLGGAGGGGRILISCPTNVFAGSVTAYGGLGTGAYAGGAGTIWKAQTLSYHGGELLVDNGGATGTNTALNLSWPIDLHVRGGAIGYASADFLVLSNLTVGDGGALTLLNTQSNLDLVVLGRATIQTNGMLNADGLGFPVGVGPGAGLSTNALGSGAGHGGAGGASSLLPGGPAYGSIERPLEKGSGGGAGYPAGSGGSQGGGAIRLTVGQVMELNGVISANGNKGLLDDSGGGSGGSILVSANTLAGTGLFQANGGAGELLLGGAGAGGRIALYSKTNLFSGSASVEGGNGWTIGEPGSIFTSSVLDVPIILSHSPSGVVSNEVHSVDLVFNVPLPGSAISPTAFALNTPYGPLLSPAISSSQSGANVLRLTFPPQTAVGDYTLTAMPGFIYDAFGQPLSLSYTGTFSILLPQIEGTVTNSLGQPVAGVLLRHSLGSSAVTDANGHYSIGAPPSYFTITPLMDPMVFVPGARAYSSITNSIAGENYLAVSTIVPEPTWAPQGTNVATQWFGIPGVRYQWESSPDLINWTPFGEPTVGTNGLSVSLLPVGADPSQFFRLRASN